MIIDWGTLGAVVLISFAAAVAVIVLFSLGVTALARSNYSTAATSGADRDMVASETTADEQGPRQPAALATAILCFVVCALVVSYGLYIIIAK